jgi:hypothetical protein
LRFFDKLFGRKRRDRRVTARFRVTVAQGESAYWTEDIGVGGMRMSIGKQLSIGDLTGGGRDVPLSIELDMGPVTVYGDPIWTVRMDDGQLATGWMFTRFDDDAEDRLADFIKSID